MGQKIEEKIEKEEESLLFLLFCSNIHVCYYPSLTLTPFSQ